MEERIKEEEKQKYITVEGMLMIKYGLPEDSIDDMFRVILWASSPSVQNGIVSAERLRDMRQTVQKIAKNKGMKSDEYHNVVFPLIIENGVFNQEFDLPFRSPEFRESYEILKKQWERILIKL